MPLLRDALPLEIFVPVLAVTLVAKLAAFFPAYAIDDYALASADPTVPTRALLAQGRFGQAALLHALSAIGLQPHYARIFFAALAMAVTAACATLVVRLWRVESRPVAIAAAAMISVHPFTTEIFTFRTALGIYAVAFALLLPLLVPRLWTLRAFLLATIYFALLTSIYQVVLQYLLAALILAAAIELVRWSGRAAPPLDRGATARAGLRERFLRDERTALFGVVVGGSAVYLTANTLLLRAFDISMVARGRILAAAEIGDRARTVWNALRYRFVEPNPMGGRVSQTLLLVLLVAAVAGLILPLRATLPRRRLTLLVGVATLLAAGLLWTIGLTAVVEFFWPVPRAMAHVAIVWGGVLVLAGLCWPRPARRWLLGLACLILLAFVGTDNRILNDQFRLNLRDLAMANRILARVESAPGFLPTTPVAIIGVKAEYPLGFATSDMDMNYSAFGATWANLAILREVSGYNLQTADAGAMAAAGDYCRTTAPWPADGSVSMRNGVAIVCLAPPSTRQP